MAIRITRAPRTYLFRGQWLTRAQIADALGMSEASVRHRIQGDTVLDIGRKPMGPAPKLYHFRGEQLTVAEICKITGQSRATVHRHVSGDRVLEGEELKASWRDRRWNERTIKVKGKSKTPTEWGAITGLPSYVIRQRMAWGWPAELAATQRVMSPGQRAQIRQRVTYMLARYQAARQGQSHGQA